MGLFLRKNQFLRCWDWLSLLNWIGALTLSLLLKLPPRKLERWIVLRKNGSVKFLSSEVALYLCKSTIRPRAGATICYLKLLDKLQKRICSTVGPSLEASLQALAHHRNVASLSLFCRYYFGRSSSELAQLVPIPSSRGRCTPYSYRLHDFSVTIPGVCVNSFIPRTARLWNSLPIECFPFTYGQNGFRSI